MLLHFHRYFFTPILIGALLVISVSPHPAGVAQATSTTTDATSSVTTDDASAQSDTTTHVNTNHTETSGSSSTSSEPNPGTTTAQDTASSSDPDPEHTATTTATNTPSSSTNSTASSSEPGATHTSSSTASSSPATSISASNTATTSVDVDTSANTGNNRAGGNTGSASVTTGNAVATANVVNLVNTNIVNSDGFIRFFNGLFGVSETDLRHIFSVFDGTTAASTDPCSSSTCDESSTTVQNTNRATTTNNVSATANSGRNVVWGVPNGSITSGDAYAAANVVNVANTNITDSNYVLLSFNNFGSHTGDIVLPGADSFAQQFRATGSHGTASNTNVATIENDVHVAADSGNNHGGDIATGDASASSMVTNLINQNGVGGDNFLMLIRVHGDWAGDVFGAPEGVRWEQTEQGVMLYSDSDTASPLAGAQTASVTNRNNATITNSVQVMSLTGDNKLENASGTISTGNAYAAANLMNIANTNILGQNWALLIFNIFGNWNGNLTFGQPDLWVGAKATADEQPIMPGDTVTYTFTVSNNGDTTAPNARLDLDYDPQHLRFSDSAITNDSISIGDLAPNETRTVTYRAHVSDGLERHQENTIPLTIEAAADQPDGDPSDNVENITVTAGEVIKRDSNDMGRVSFPANLAIRKTASVATATAPTTVTYTITVKNSGGPSYRSLLIDTLRDSSGNVLQEEVWELDTIAHEETVAVSYEIQFSSSTPPDTYRNEAQVLAMHKNSVSRLAEGYDSAVAAAEVTISNATPQVLGASTTNRCEPYLTNYIHPNATNDPSAVRRLQLFLILYEDEQLPLDGTYNTPTQQAVARYQTRYADEVLTPWGLSSPTSHVYYTTRKHINEQFCLTTQSFPLSPAEQLEIMRYRTLSLTR